MTATKEERIAYLQEKGPNVSLFDFNREVSIILLRDGKEEHHTFYRNTIEVMFPQSCRSSPGIPNDAPDYFIYAPTNCPAMNDEIIPLTKDEAEIISYRIYELNSAADAEAAEEEKKAVQTEWADARQRILAVHEARMAADAAKQLAERMRVQADIIEEYGSEEAFQKSRAHGEEAMRLIQIAERARQATEGYKY